MKHFLLAVLFSCCCIPAFAQGMFGAQLGVGFNSGGYHSKKTPAIEAYYLHKVIPGLYTGASVFFQRYSLLNELNAGSSPAYGDVISVRQKSSYLFLSPKIDYGFGVRKYLHIYATFGAGLFVGGGQWSNTHSPYWTPPGATSFGADTIAVNTTYNIPGVIMRYGFGFTERIPTSGYWNITLSQEYGGMPGGLSEGPHPFKTSYFCFSVGIMHKYPLAFVEY